MGSWRLSLKGFALAKAFKVFLSLACTSGFARMQGTVLAREEGFPDTEA